MLILTVVLVITLGPSIMRKQNIFPESERAVDNQLVITMHDNPNSKSYGNELRVKTIIVNGELLDLSEYANDSWVWHPEWGYVLYQQGNNIFAVDIDREVESLNLTLIKQEGSGKCTVSFNGIAEKSYDMYSSNWHEVVYSVRYFDTVSYVFFLFSVCIVIYALLIILYRVFLYGTGKIQVTPLRVGIGTFDLIKGFGILGVMLGHSAEQVASNGAFFAMA